MEIESLPNGGVIVRKEYPADRRRRDGKIVAVICSVLCLIPVIVWGIYHSTLPGRFASAVTAFFAVSIGTSTFRQFAANTRSIVLRADQTGLTIEMADWRRQTTNHFTRGQVDDIVLDCSGGTDPHSGAFKSFLVIKPSGSRRIRCLHNVGGDHLARVANALRKPLGMPTRTWP